MAKQINVQDGNNSKGNLHKGDSWGKRFRVVDIATEHFIIAKTFRSGLPKKGSMRVIAINGKK